MKYFLYMSCDIQLRESISQDQEKTEIQKIKMQDLENKIADLNSKIDHVNTTLKELQEIKLQISMKSATRNTLFREQERKYANLSEEIEGLFFLVNQCTYFLCRFDIRHSSFL